MKLATAAGDFELAAGDGDFELTAAGDGLNDATGGDGGRFVAGVAFETARRGGAGCSVDGDSRARFFRTEGGAVRVGLASFGVEAFAAGAFATGLAAVTRSEIARALAGRCFAFDASNARACGAKDTSTARRTADALLERCMPPIHPKVGRRAKNPGTYEWAYEAPVTPSA